MADLKDFETEEELIIPFIVICSEKNCRVQRETCMMNLRTYEEALKGYFSGRNQAPSGETQGDYCVGLFNGYLCVPQEL